MKKSALLELLYLSVFVTIGCGSTSAGNPDGGNPDGAATSDCPAPTGAGTMHTGTIAANETWTAAGSPHNVTSDVQIRGATVTIEPCAIVQIARGRSITIGENSGAPASLVAHGTSDASGMHLKEIDFVPATAGDHWGMIRLFPTGSVDFELVGLSGGGDPSTAQASGGTIVAQGPGQPGPLKPMVRVRSVAIVNSGGFGVNLQSFAAFTADSDNLVIQGAGSLPSSSSIDTSFPIYVWTPAVQTIPAGTYTGNKKDEILVNQGIGASSFDETFHDRGVPYHLRSTLTVAPKQSAAMGGLQTLTLDAGVTLKFEKSGSSVPLELGLGVSSGGTADAIYPTRLVADGTAKPIVLTSAQAAPAPGDWVGIKWNGGPATGNVIRNVTVEFAGGFSGTANFGCGPAQNDAAVIITNWRPDDAFIQGSTFSSSAGAGVVSGWISDLSGPDFKTGNTFTGIGNGCAVSHWKRMTTTACPTAPAAECY